MGSSRCSPIHGCVLRIQEQLRGRFQLVDLPVNPLPMDRHNPVHILRGLLWSPVGTNVACLQTVANGQHIHTDRGSLGSNTLGAFS